MDYSINSLGHEVNGEIKLPTSKSISNRLLILQALSKSTFKIDHLSESDDTRVMQAAFLNPSHEVNIGHAGTAMRFLTAYYAAIGSEKIITGSERMRNRPIAALVDGLNQLGAKIHYLDKIGYPPIKTSGLQLNGKEITIDGDISSQFITALLLIAPTLPFGLTVHIAGRLISPLMSH